jgi:hypothetical protein
LTDQEGAGCRCDARRHPRGLGWWSDKAVCGEALRAAEVKGGDSCSSLSVLRLDGFRSGHSLRRGRWQLGGRLGRRGGCSHTDDSSDRGAR